MICEPCKRGGATNRALNQFPGVAKAAAYHQKRAAESHAKCEAPTTCPCHHFVGDAINKQPGGQS